MKKEFHTPKGVETRDLTEKEIAEFASRGDPEALKEIARAKLKGAQNTQERVDIILEYLGLRE